MRNSLILLLLFPWTSWAQQSLPQPLMPGEIFFRFSPTGLFHFTDPNVSFGLEKKLLPRFSVAIDAGFVPHSFKYDAAKRTTGILLRPSARYYPGRRTFYIEGELYFKRVTHVMEDWIGRNVVEGVASHEEFARFRYRRVVSGISVQTGRVMRISREDDRWWWEVYGGIGFRSHHFQLVDEPRSRWVFTNFWGTPDEARVVGALPIGLRILYRVKHSRMSKSVDPSSQL